MVVKIRYFLLYMFYEEDIFSQLGKINGKQGKIFFSNWEKNTPSRRYSERGSANIGIV